MHSTLASILLSALALVASGCGSDEVDITGDTPEQAAAEISTAVCERNVECGTVEISCDAVETGFDCTGTIKPTDYDQCVAEAEPAFLMDLQACDLTPAQEDAVSACINASLAQDCITQAELDAAITEFEAGRRSTVFPMPPECEGVEAFFTACGG